MDLGGQHQTNLLPLFTCIVLHGNEHGGKPSYCSSLLFWVIAPVLVHRSTHTPTHPPTHTYPHPHAHTHTLTSYARELHHFKGFNLCTKKMAGGGKLEGEYGCFFRRRGSTSEGPLISHNPARLNTQGK